MKSAEDLKASERCCFTCALVGYSEKRKEYYCRLRTLTMSKNAATNMLCIDGRWRAK